MSFDMDHLVKLRHQLHQYPELSHQEINTAAIIEGFLAPLVPDQLIRDLGGHGIAAVFTGKQPGKTVLLRCDMDALPIQETNDFIYRSKIENVSHKCGHDGHMVIMMGLAELLSRADIPSGRVVLLFQPAEERGEGALKVLQDSKFNALQPDRVFALHNLPGFPRGSVILGKDVFCAASVGMEIKLLGKTSHAAEPSRGINPARAVSDIIRAFDRTGSREEFQDLAFITIVHVRLGEIAYGTSAGDAEIRATLRAYQNRDMEKLIAGARKTVQNCADREKLTVKVKMVEYFPAAVNHPDCLHTVRKAAQGAGLETRNISAPFPWSEDFSQFLLRYPGCLFGIGAGERQPKVHNPDYDFPDEIIPQGISVYAQILRQLLGVKP